MWYEWLCILPNFCFLFIGNSDSTVLVTGCWWPLPVEIILIGVVFCYCLLIYLSPVMVGLREWRNRGEYPQKRSVSEVWCCDWSVARHPCLVLSLRFFWVHHRPSEFYFSDTENVANKMNLKSWLEGLDCRSWGNAITSGCQCLLILANWGCVRSSRFR